MRQKMSSIDCNVAENVFASKMPFLTGKDIYSSWVSLVVLAVENLSNNILSSFLYCSSVIRITVMLVRFKCAWSKSYLGVTIWSE
jgi:hypothetical protein